MSNEQGDWPIAYVENGMIVITPEIIHALDLQPGDIFEKEHQERITRAVLDALRASGEISKIESETT